MIRRTSSGFIICVIVAALAACKKAEDKPAASKEAATATAPPAAPGGGAKGKADEIEARVDELKAKAGDLAEKAIAGAKEQVAGAKVFLKEGEQLTAAKYEELVVALADCTVDDNGIDAKCPAQLALRDALNRSQAIADLAGQSASVGRKLLGHGAPAVRLYAAGMMASFLGTDASSQELIAEAAMKETDLAVLKAMLRTVANDGARNPKIGALLLWAADHADPGIRMSAVSALSSTWNRELAGGPERLAKLMLDDADAKVRQAACESAGRLGLDAVYPAYAKVLEDDSDLARWGTCFDGLIEMWLGYPFYENASEKAYKLTLKLLGKTPRKEGVPPWMAISALAHMEGDDFAKWMAAHKWFKAADMRKVLTALIADKDAHWMPRNYAVAPLVSLGATKADLEKLRKGMSDDTSKSDDHHVSRALDEALAKM